MTEIVILISSFIVSLILVKITKYLSISYGIHDIPNGRKIHKERIPTMGGLAIFSTIWIVMFGLDIAGIVTFEEIMFKIFAVSIAFLIVGMIDDIVGLSAKFKFIVQMSSGIAFFFWINNNTIVLFHDILLSNIILAFLFLFFFTFMSNSINFTDGMDGLCAGISIIYSITLFIIAQNTGCIYAAYLLIAQMGALFGFIMFNFYPAKIFMGDTGSLFLGSIFSMITIILIYFRPDGVFAFIMIFTYLIIDVTLAVIRRLIMHKNIFKADKLHIHHIIDSRLGKQKITVMIIYLINAIFALLGILYYYTGQLYLIAVYLILSASIFIYFFISIMSRTAQHDS
ncbi:MAG: MraY family glycosyltransferase [candidate division WOR-3 bacterium]|nr:MraY family glycosyltransferase [candidate division WOR-3 bacterium]